MENTFYRTSEYNENWKSEKNEKGLQFMTHQVFRTTDGDKVCQDDFPEVFTLIEANGSKWMGQRPDDVDSLLDVLCEHKMIGHFYPGFEGVDKYDWYKQKGVVRFHGNFEKLSHCFSIDTNDPEIIFLITEHLKVNAEL